jgi:hypothetical protein
LNPGLARAERLQAVRDDARAWQRAGTIDAPTLAAVEQRFPDDRRRVGPIFRILLFGFTLVGVAAALSMFLTLFVQASGLLGSRPAELAAAIAGAVALTALTEVQLGPLRRRQGGIEAATSLVAVACALSAVFLASYETAVSPGLIGLGVAALLAAAAWRWGYPFYAAAAGVVLLLAAGALLPEPRAVWIVATLAAALPLSAAAASPRLPPSHRASCAALLAVALAGLYVAVNFVAMKGRWIELLGGPPKFRQATPFELRAAAVGTAVLPLVLLAVGVRWRRRVWILAGIAATVASLVTARYYLQAVPLWAALAGGGALFALAALTVQRYLESGPAGERGGFTTAPLYTDDAHQALLETAAAVAAFTPAPAAATSSDAGFTGEGGRSGGGGAAGSY